jgi:sulfate permease, SulP family
MTDKPASRSTGRPAGQSVMGLVRHVFPIVGQLASYRTAWLSADLMAGLSVAAVALPTAIAYPEIAGLPPQAGLYAAILPAVGYALFGPSRQLMIGPDTATTVMLASALVALGIVDPGQRVAAAAALAVAVGLCCLVAGFFRLGFIANFLSRPVLMGFLSGVALDLLVKQLGRLTAVPIKAGGLVPPLIELASKLDRVNPTTLMVGLGIFVVLRLLHRFAPRFPAPLLAIAIGVLSALAFDLGSRGVQLVGAIPDAWPVFALPLPGPVAIDDFILGALSILLVSFGSGIVTARSFGAKNHYQVDANRELIGFGAANIASGLFGGFPVSSSDSRTAVNDAVGGRSQLAGLAAAAGLLGAVLFLGELLAYLPAAALGAVIASAAIDLTDLRGFMALWRLSRIEMAIALIALAGVMSLGILTGVVVAIGATMAHLLWLASNPRDALLGRIPGHDGLYKLHRHPDAAPIPGLVIYLPQAALLFFNVEYVMRRLLKSARRLHGPGTWLILDGIAMNYLDTTAVAALEDVRADLARRGIAFGIADLHRHPRETIERAGLAERIGADMLFDSAEQAVAAFAARPAAVDEPPAAPAPSSR